jgi:hypothetical protein
VSSHLGGGEHTVELVHDLPKPAVPIRDFASLDDVDKAIIEIVKDPEYPGGLTPSCINSLLRRRGINPGSLAGVGKRLTVLSRERRLMYVRMGDVRYVVSMPGEGWRSEAAAGRERGAGALISDNPSFHESRVPALHGSPTDAARAACPETLPVHNHGVIHHVSSLPKVPAPEGLVNALPPRMKREDR